VKLVNTGKNYVRRGCRPSVWSKVFPEMEILYWELGGGTQTIIISYSVWDCASNKDWRHHFQSV